MAFSRIRPISFQLYGSLSVSIRNELLRSQFFWKTGSALFFWLLEGFSSFECRKWLANCFGFALLHSVIGSKFWRHFLNQSEVKPKPIVACACTFSRALCRLRIITLSFDWFTGLPASFLIGQGNYLQRHSTETRSKFSGHRNSRRLYNFGCSCLSPGDELLHLEPYSRCRPTSPWDSDRDVWPSSLAHGLVYHNTITEERSSSVPLVSREMVSGKACSLLSLVPQHST